MNHAVERPGVQIDFTGSFDIVEPGEVITPDLYVRAYRLCRQAIKALPGHENDQVLVGAVAPWNNMTTYPGNPNGDWVQHFQEILELLGPEDLDGITIHTYTHSADPENITSNEMMNPPFQNRRYHFRAYQDFMEVIPAEMRHLPVYITETDQDTEWSDENSGWVQAAYAEIDRWNSQPGNQKIHALALYRWQQVDRWGIDGKQGVIADLRQALQNDYRWNAPASDLVTVASLSGSGGELNNPTVMEALAVGVPWRDILSWLGSVTGNPRLTMEMQLPSGLISVDELDFDPQMSRQLLLDTGLSNIPVYILYPDSSPELEVLGVEVLDALHELGIGAVLALQSEGPSSTANWPILTLQYSSPTGDTFLRDKLVERMPVFTIFTDIIREMSGEQWLIGDTWVVIDGSTQILGNPAIGSTARVIVRRSYEPSDVIVARVERVEVEDATGLGSTPVSTRTPTPILTTTPALNISLPTLTPRAPGILLDFETLGAWERDDEPYGTLTQASDRQHSGSASARLAYAMPAVARNYVVFLRQPPLAIPGRPEALNVWVYGDGSGHFLNAWIQDAQGEVRQFTFGQVQHANNWQQMTAPLDVTADWPQGSISGPNNGQLDYPIKLYGLMLDVVPDGAASSGAIYLDDLGSGPGTPTLVATPPSEIGIATPSMTPVAERTPPEPLPLSAVVRRYQGKILFYANRPDQRGWYVMDPDGRNRVYLGDSQAIRELYNELRQGETLSPDGTCRVYATMSEADEYPQVYAQCQTSHDTTLTLPPTWKVSQGVESTSYDPVWSPDGRRIAFVSQRLGSDDIWIANAADGSDQRNLTPNDWEWDKHPSWAPDSRRIVFWSNRDGRSQIFVVDTDDVRIVGNISDTTWDEYDPVWLKQ